MKKNIWCVFAFMMVIVLAANGLEVYAIMILGFVGALDGILTIKREAASKDKLEFGRWWMDMIEAAQKAAEKRAEKGGQQCLI